MNKNSANDQNTIKRGKVKDTAYDEIKRMILSLEIRPGKFVSENNLSVKLGISRTPIREALKDLEKEGLIISENRKKKVYVLTIGEVEEIFDLKKIIEGNVVKWATERGNEEHFKSIKQILSDMQNVYDKKPNSAAEIDGQWINEWIEVDKRLHSVFFEMANNKRAQQIITTLNTQWHRLRLGLLAIEGRLEKSIIEHQEIAKAMIEKNPEKAKLAMKSHLENLKIVLVSIMRAFSFHS